MGDMYNNNSILYQSFPDAECNYAACRKYCIKGKTPNFNDCLKCNKLYGILQTPCIKKLKE